MIQYMVTRRRFLGWAVFGPIAAIRAVGSARAQGLDRFTSGTTPCKDEKPTASVPDDKTFRPGAPERAVLAGRDVAGRRLTIAGTVSGVVCGPIKGARVDFWQADASGRYDALHDVAFDYVWMLSTVGLAAQAPAP